MPAALFPLLALMLGQAQAPAPTLPAIPIESYKLPNGLKVVLQRDATVPRVTVLVGYHVGSKDERAGRTGFAHFFEHMMFRGTKHVPNYDIPLQETGAQSNAETSEDTTVYYESVPSHWLERALYLEAERQAFLPGAIDREKFDTEREVVKNERRQGVDNVPYGLAEEVILAGLFPKGHPYSWSVIGSMADLDRSSVDDLRRFFHEFYHPGNATLCLVGDFDPEPTKAMIGRYFGPLAAGRPRRKVEAGPFQVKAERLERADKVQFSRVYWAWPAVAETHEDAPALDVLATILASGEASRLYRALIRDQYLAADVNAHADTKEVAGLFTIDATAAEGKTIAEVEGVLKAELGKIREKAPEEAEMRRALAKIETAFAASLSTPLDRAKVLASGFSQYDDPEYYRKDFDRYFRVKAEDVRRVAAKYLTPEKLILVVNPAGDAEPHNPPVVAGPVATDAPEAPLAERPPSGNLDWKRMPGPSLPRPFVAPKIARKTMASGLEVWVIRREMIPLVQAQLVIPRGTADDPPGKASLAMLAAAMFDKGTKELDSAEFTEALEELGATVAVGTGVDFTTVSLATLSRTLDPALQRVGELLVEPRWDGEDWQRERELHMARLVQGPDDVNWLAGRAFRALLYGPDHPYGTPADGTEKSVMALGLGDLKASHDRYVRPGGSHLIVVGAVDPDALFRRLEADWQSWTGKAPAASERPAPKVQPEADVAYLVDKPGAVQSVLSVGRRWEGRKDPRYFACLLGNRLLGGDFLSRLNQNLRERNGFTYGAGSGFSYRRDGSVWLASTTVRADATAPALKELLGELEGVAGKRPFTNEEIVTNQAAELQSYPERFESLGALASMIREIAELRLPADSFDTFMEKLRGVEPPEVIAAMGEVVEPTGRIVLVVGDRKAVEPELKALGKFREIRRVDADGRPVGN
ncbi:MAG: pitrilysin family protein [Isosphaeraceae bacterium]